MKIKLNRLQFALIIMIALIILVCFWAIGYYTRVRNEFSHFNRLEKSITNYDECVKAGYKVMQTYPLQCQGPDGKIFMRANISPTDVILPTLSPSQVNKYICTSDSDCTLLNTAELNTFSLCCQLNRCADYSKDTVQAVSTSWLIAQRTSFCGNRKFDCPAIASMCTRQIAQTALNYEAKCIKSICQKIYTGQ